MTEKLSSGGRARSATLRASLTAMYGLSAVYPEVQPSTPAFASLIIFCWLIISDGHIHPAETRLLTKLVAPRIKLRRDDVEFVCNQIQERGMDERHLKWLVSFIQSGIAPDAKRRAAGVPRQAGHGRPSVASGRGGGHPQGPGAVGRQAAVRLTASFRSGRAGTAQACPKPPSRYASACLASGL
jgi:hypothetical protein